MPNLFPSSLAGFGFSVMKTPQFKTKIQRAVSGRELRLTYQPVPTWMFRVRFEFLRDSSDQRQANNIGPSGWGTNSTDLRNLMGFFLNVQGSLTSFYLDDPTDDAVVGQSLGSGDGTSTQFQLFRTLGVGGVAFNEPIIAPNLNVTPTLTVGGSPKTYGTDYSISAPGGIVTFLTGAPGSGQAILISYSYYFLCRMGEDTQDFEYFLYQLWSVEGLKLQSILL